MSKKVLSKSRSKKSLQSPKTVEARAPGLSPPSASEPQIVDETGKSERSGTGFTIVGIGASAGGYEAFMQLLSSLHKDTGMAFVLIQHLDPTHESKLSQLLARSTTLPLVEARNAMRVEPDHVYVMPPNVDMRISGGKLVFQPRRKHATHMPVDIFFRSLAEHQQSRAIGIVLSGTGTDGTLGLQAINGGGGITFAQDEKSAKYFGMPGSAINAGVVDVVLTPEEMGSELTRIGRHPYTGRGVKPKQPARAPGETPENDKIFQETGGDLSALFALLRARTNVDFSLYKHSTLKRRILRRMLLHRIDSLPHYLQHLRTHLADVDALFNDLLINVTEFFRDPPVFQVLKRRIFPRLVQNRPSDTPLRIWVCGCSTGEEAYSIAIGLVEFFESARVHLNVQIFATDISEASLEKARSGIYPENISLDVSPERLRRFFVKANGGYQVSKSIRDMCVFARQNVIVDPPFSNLDLISCRNVLIYLGQALQKKIMPAFHYALKPDGFLLLGCSEAIGAAADLFTLYDKKSKLYTKKTAAYRAGFPMVYQKDAVRSEPRLESAQLKAENRIPDLQQHVDRMILAKWCPAAVVINSQMDVLLFRGRTGSFLEHAAGNASLNLLKMARENLALDLRTAISKAIKQDSPVRQDNVPLRQDHNIRPVSVEVVPFQLAPASERFYMVLFFEQALGFAQLPALPAATGSSKARVRQENERRVITQLRGELASTKESLQAIIEEQEATNEELKSANEEIQSSNEELQSTNEELETAKEELQSTNEELTTLNEELQTRNSELSQVNNDLTNLLSSVNVAIIMLADDLTIRRFTPMAERVFNLIPSDVGRRLSDLNRTIVVPDLDEAIRHVVDNLSVVDREVQDRDGHWFSLRIRPYRTRENKIDGAVLLLVDINEHKRAIEFFMTSVKQPLLALQTDLRVKSANPAFYKFFKVDPGETEGRHLNELGNGQWMLPKLRVLLEDVLAKKEPLDDFVVEADFPRIGWRKLYLDARIFTEDEQNPRLVIVSFRDMTTKKDE